jgi:pilus assembly protein FimV
MVAKCSSRAVALLLALPSAAFALGLGDIHLLSPLNAPLNAEIELVDVAPDEVNVQAQLASRETFARYGLDWPAYLTGVQVRTEHAADGRQIIRLKSTDPISEPFVTLLVEVNWSRGRLVREYTMLLDPPVYASAQPAVASAPVSAPATGAATREGAIERAAPTTPAQAETRPAPMAAATPAPAEASSSPAAGAANAGGTHLVRRGETLSGIASATAGAGTGSARTRSWMLAIYQANPRAFDSNMNLLRSGAVLRIPDGATAAGISSADASAEIRRQYAAWRGAAGSAAAGEQPGRLHLVTPSQAAAAGATPKGQAGEPTQLQSRVTELEGQVAEQKRLLDMKNADLARLQAQLAEKQGKPAAVESAVPPPAPTTPAPAATPPVEQTPPAAAATEQKPPAETPRSELAPTPAEAPPLAAKPPVAKRPAAAAQPQGGSIFDTLKDYWWALALLALGLIAWFVLRFFRSRRSAEFDDSLGRLAMAGGAAATAGAAMSRGFTSADAPSRAAEPALTEDSFLVDESGVRPRPRLAPEPVTAAPPVRQAADDTISSETAINLDQGDPLAEADFHMAYGLYDQAADLIRIAISREPARRDLKLKLLEVFFVWGNKEQFLQTARELAGTRSESAPGEWEKILIMGKQLAPEDALFSGGGATSGAAAGGVDLDLEGGQSRVDFDLLGEPDGAAAPQGVDLDIGAAVGHSASESTTNVTDRNSALLENTYLQGATTGTTRQMTTPVRQVSGDAEGPTVEQPALAQPGSPTVRQKVETALKQSGADQQTQELAIDDLGLDLGHADTVDQPGLAAAAPEGPTLVAGLDEHTRQLMEDVHQHGATHEKVSSTGAWQFDPKDLDSAATQQGQALSDPSQTSRLKALGAADDVDVDVGDATSTHPAPGALDLDVGATTGTHASNGHGLDLDVGTATVPDTAFAATQRLSSEDLALPDLEPVTMSEVGTKLDLARAYMDMGDPDGARNILEEVLAEGSAAQKQEAQRLMESLP